MRLESKNLQFEVAKMGRTGETEVLEICMAWRGKSNFGGFFPLYGIHLILKLYWAGC